MDMLDYNSMQPISPELWDKMKQALVASDYPSCEYAFANLVIWSDVFGTRCCEYEGKLYFHMPDIDELLFPCGGMPTPEELRKAAAGMQAAGYSGRITHVPESYLASPDLDQYFTVGEREPGNDEYVYLTSSLAALHGSKLQKKRNLISQFERQYPIHEIKEVAGKDDFSTIISLREHWVHEHIDTQSIENERCALRKALAHFDELGLQGLMLYADGELKAYAVYSRINSDSYTVHFEKALSECKGASQLITRSTAEALQGRCEYINREQDLNLPGLRQAKQSYVPHHMLIDYTLVPK